MQLTVPKLDFSGETDGMDSSGSAVGMDCSGGLMERLVEWTVVEG